MKKLFLLFTILLSTQLLPWSPSGTIYQNKKNGHTIALLGDEHNKSGQYWKEKLFYERSHQYFNQLFQSSNIHFILEGDTYIKNKMIKSCHEFIQSPPMESFLYIHSMFNSLALLGVNTDMDTRRAFFNVLNFDFNDFLIEVNDFRCNTLGYWSDLILNFINEIEVNLDDLYNNSPVNRSQLKTIANEQNSEIRDWKTIQWLHKNNPNEVEKINQKILEITPSNNNSSTQSIIKEVQEFINQCQIRLNKSSSVKSQKVWEYYRNLFQILLNDANALFEGQDQSFEDFISEDLSHKSSIFYGYDKKSYKETPLSIIINSVADFGFVCSSLDSYQYQKHAFLYAGNDHIKAISKLLPSFGYQEIITYTSNDQPLSQEQTKNFFEIFLECSNSPIDLMEIS